MPENMLEKNNQDLRNLEEKINKLQEAKDKKQSQNLGRGGYILIELSAALIVGLLAGWYLDIAFNTKPLGMILCIIFSFIAAMRKLYQS